MIAGCSGEGGGFCLLYIATWEMFHKNQAQQDMFAAAAAAAEAAQRGYGSGSCSSCGAGATKLNRISVPLKGWRPLTKSKKF
jgi:hypothetical protein